MYWIVAIRINCIQYENDLTKSQNPLNLLKGEHYS